MIDIHWRMKDQVGLIHVVDHYYVLLPVEGLMDQCVVVVFAVDL